MDEVIGVCLVATALRLASPQSMMAECMEGRQSESSCRKVCDGRADYSDGRDERLCAKFDCIDGSFIMRRQVCNRLGECPGSHREDEGGEYLEFCNYISLFVPCDKNNRRGKKVKYWQQCDGVRDCPGGQDEEGCLPCEINKNSYYKREWVSDGLAHCGVGSREQSADTRLDLTDEPMGDWEITSGAIDAISSSSLIAIIIVASTQ